MVPTARFPASHTGLVPAVSLPGGEPSTRRRAPAAVARLPGGPGVYRFRDAGGAVLYVGRAAALRPRVASYWSDLGHRSHLAPMVARVARIEAVSCDSPHEAAWLERNLLETSLPAWNRTAGGQENVVYIRLDERPSAPALTVARHRQPARQVRYFGPYLGGLRARQAVAALNRVLPLAYTGTHLRGVQLGLARARRVGPAHREAFLRTLRAVLRRQPEAVAGVRRELEQLRHHAAESLAFEFAGRVHSEISALDWVTGPQRVTTMDAGDFDACGWSGEVLVRFAIRGGRLCEWSQHACPRSRAVPRLAVTPAGWAGFARRNAELAAALAAEARPPA